jgi:glycosyltransferase involved in cell wall biosynthesis
MNIAFLTPEFPHPKTGSSGGIGSSIQNLSHCLVSLGHSVFVYVYAQDTDERFTEDNLTIIRIRNQQVKGLSWWLTRKKIERIINADCKTYGIEVLEVPDWTGISAWINIQCKMVMRLHGSDSYFCALESRKVKWWNTFQEQTAYAQADGIIAVSKFVGEQTNTIFKSNKPFTVIHNGIPTNIFIPEETATSSTPCILYFGTLIRTKGVLEIPQIFNKVRKQISDVNLILIGADASDIQSGSPSTWELMKPMFEKEALKQVSYLGKVPYETIRHHINDATLCIFPSYAEACPVSWLEAMAMGKPIVTSDIGWANEIVDHNQTGMTAYPNNHEEFSRHIITLLKNPELRVKMGKLARKKITEAFNITLTAQKSVDVYTQLVNTDGF